MKQNGKKDLVGFQFRYFPRGTRLIYGSEEISYDDVLGCYPDLSTYCLSKLGYMLLEYLLDENDCTTEEIWVIESMTGVGFAQGLNNANEVVYEFDNQMGDLELINYEALIRDLRAWSKEEEFFAVIAVMYAEVNLTVWFGNAEVDYVDIVYCGLLDMEKIVTMTNLP